ncbi:transposase [Streptomyces sp. URMC 126]|uniref:transposase n=1 Tax=Streptomyces sp. URMC 126 TaxID=3423401 RepID=UPI003F1E365C
MDSRSVKASETVGRDSRGFDGAMLINGRKQHFAVDTRGLVLLVMVTPADVTDREAAKEPLFRLNVMHPEIATVWAGSNHAGKLVAWAKDRCDIALETVRRPPNTKRFVVLPRRWVVEGSLLWITRARRHCRDHERLPQVGEPLITWASITLMTRCLTREPARKTVPRTVPAVMPAAA